MLGVAADSGRILVTQDRRTTPSHFAQFYRTTNKRRRDCGPKDIPIGVAVEELLLIWAASQAEEWHDRLLWIPL